MTQWFLGREDNRQGPFTDEQVIQLLVQGKINGKTSIWREGLSAPIPLGRSEIAAMLQDSGKEEAAAEVSAAAASGPVKQAAFPSQRGQSPQISEKSSHHKWFVGRLAAPNIPNIRARNDPATFALMMALIAGMIFTYLYWVSAEIPADGSYTETQAYLGLAILLLSLGTLACMIWGLRRARAIQELAKAYNRTPTNVGVGAAISAMALILVIWVFGLYRFGQLRDAAESPSKLSSSITDTLGRASTL